MRLLAVSVDLDEIPNYHQIHGLAEPDGAARTLVYDRAIGRLRQFAKDAQIPLTLFVIGADLERREAAEALRAAAREGHELANHSLDHMYDFSKLSRSGIRTQVEGGVRAIQGATGILPTGFRAPGYTVNDEVFAVLSELEVGYDSSVFPCPVYYAAKTAAVGGILAQGRTSRSVLDTPNVLRAPTRPYRVGKPYWTRGAGVLELPVQVTRGARLPFIGTSVTLAGPSGARLLARMCVGEELINLELHGIDLLDASDGLQGLSSYQPDVRVPVARKLAALHAVVDTLRAQDYRAVTLAEAAVAFT